MPCSIGCSAEVVAVRSFGRLGHPVKFPPIFAILSAAAVKCWAAAVTWTVVVPAAAIAVAWTAFGTRRAPAGAGIGIRRGRMASFVGEPDGTLAFYSAIAAFDSYALWWGLSRGSRELTWLAAFFLVIAVGCWVAIRVSERRREAA